MDADRQNRRKEWRNIRCSRRSTENRRQMELRSGQRRTKKGIKDYNVNTET